MGAYLDLPAGNAALKEHYDDQKVENLAYDDNPGLVMVPKQTDATGKVWPVPVIFETSQGNSATFANAQGNQSPMLLAEFLVPLRPEYGVATLANQLMKASADKAGSFIDFATKYVDVMLQGVGNRIASALYRSGTGSIGTVNTIAAGVITFTNASDVTSFGVNQTLQAASTDGGAPRAALGWVVARDVMAGTITVSATAMGGAAGSPAGWAAGDFLLVQGDSNAKLSGFSSWLPLVAPATTDNFYGVNRSVDSRLYGLAYPGTAQPVEEAVIDAAMLVAREKGKPKHLLTNYGTYAATIKAMGARREFVDWESKDGVIGFRGAKIEGPNGTIQMFPDRSCQSRTGYLLQMPTWQLLSLGGTPHIFKYGDGLEMLRLGNADASEVRGGAYLNLACDAPGWNSQVTFGV